MTLPAGTCLGPYQVLGPLGSGGMGEVYRARDNRLRRDVAVKLLPAAEAGDAVGRARLLREARTASALNHPHICTIFDVGEVEGRVFFAMELLSGTPLDRLARPSGLPAENVVRLGIDIASALDHAHRRGVVHCDLKPANVILTETGAKVLDFGIARPLRALEAQTLTRSLETSSPLAGTPGYMAPEQLRGQPTDERTDIWALGTVLYQLASGRLPFEGDTLQDLATAVLRDPPAPLPPGLPAGLRAVIARCLAKDPAQRYQHASEVHAALEAVAGGTVEAERLEPGVRPAPPRRVFRAAWTAAVLSLVLVLAGAGFLWQRGQRGGSAARTRTLAILPLRALNQQAADDLLGLGIADALITKASQLPGLTVRPISAVRAFAKGDMDALQAARTLQVDVVLDGSVQHAQQRVRVSVNLLDARDGSSVWAESFDSGSEDIFALQDEIARAVATRLQVRLGPSEEAAIVRRFTSSPAAYTLYTKAMYHLGNRGFDAQHRLESDTAVTLLRQALALDPAFARARAQLAFGLAWTAIFIEENPDLIAEAWRELATAQRQDANLAEVSVTRALILWSKAEGWQVEEAIREMRRAQRLDPSVGNGELGAYYSHIGLDDLAERYFRRAITLSPTCETCKAGLAAHYYETAQPEQALAVEREFWNQPPSAAYYLLKRLPEEAEPLVRRQEEKEPGSADTLTLRALLAAEQGRPREAEAAMKKALDLAPKNRSYHHALYDAAVVFALNGKASESVHLLAEAAANGFNSYPLLARDRRLDAIRGDPAFVAFLAQTRARWERFKAEFEAEPPAR